MAKYLSSKSVCKLSEMTAVHECWAICIPVYMGMPTRDRPHLSSSLKCQRQTSRRSYNRGPLNTHRLTPCYCAITQILKDLPCTLPAVSLSLSLSLYIYIYIYIYILLDCPNEFQLRAEQQLLVLRGPVSRAI